ncbi:MAG: hypothetical protein WBD95_12990 [Xanthobacteraceae bacterium]
MIRNRGAHFSVQGILRGSVAGFAAIGLVVFACALAGCSFSDGIGPYIVDPGRFAVYHCPDLVSRLKELQTRQQELRDLMGKASEGGGGTVIGAISYRTDYEKALGEEKVLRRTAAEKKCELAPPAYQSDQIIR